MTARRWRPGPVALLLVVLGCTWQPGDRDAPPGDHSASPVPSRSVETAGSQPLVLAVNVRRPPLDLSVVVARRLLRREVEDWSALGQPAEPLRVTRRPEELDSLPYRTVAVVPAHALTPTVRVVRVGGVHPLRRPADYPLRTRPVRRPPAVTTVTVVGDMMLGRRVGELARSAGDPAYPLRVLKDRLARADLTVGNLESTLSRAGAPTQGSDSFAADPGVAPGLRAAGLDAVGLANNHVGDFGPRALVATVRRLRTAGVVPFGAGASRAEAWRPAVLERNGVRFGFLGFNAIGESPDVAEGGPGVVTVGMPPRTGPLDRTALARFSAAVRRLDRRVDVVVVLPHWGTQYTHRPEPVQRVVARELVEAGADLVVGGHPHWVQGAELVGRRLVVHSLGNLVFDMDFMERTREGLVLELVFWGGVLKGAEYLPYRIGQDFSPRPVAWGDASENLAGFWAFTRF